MAQNKNNNKNGGDCCSFCGAKRTDVEIMFQGSDGANIFLKKLFCRSAQNMCIMFRCICGK